MGRFGAGQSLKNVASSTGSGSVVTFPLAKARVQTQVELAGTTKAVIRVQGSVNGQTWTNLGSANSTMADGGLLSSTSATLYDHFRVNLISRTTSASATVESVSAWITG